MSVDNPLAVSSLGPARERLAGTIKQASDATGAGFAYMMASAKIESNLDSKAAAPTSSAKGLYQFIEQTWLGTMKEAGAALGYGRYANVIQRTPSGGYTVSDPATRAAILNLRNDPAANAAMGGVLTRSNTLRLVGTLGRKPSDPELYMAHFLGAGGAGRLISNAEDNPNASAPAMFPRAAAANRSVFYDRSGRARSTSQVYAELTRRYNAAANSPITRTMIASVAPAAPGVAAAPSAPSFSSSVVGVQAASVAKATAAASVAQRQEPTFRSLFQAGDRPQAVSPAIGELWGRSESAQTTASPTAAVQPKLKTPTPLDLFSDRFGTFAS